MKKNKKATLPYSGLHPLEDDNMHIISDSAKGVGKFNSSFGDSSGMPSSGGENAAMTESLEENFVDNLPQEVLDYLDFYDMTVFQRPDGTFVVDSWDSVQEFDKLDELLEAIEDDIQSNPFTDAEEEESLYEHLKNLDRQCFDEFCESYDLTYLAEASQQQLTPEDREMLKNAKTAEEASTYLKGVMVKNGTLTEADEGFEDDSDDGVDEDGYPYYVTYYTESPEYESTEGGYYYASRVAELSKGFNSLEEAREYAEELADSYEMEKFTDDHYCISSSYIGDDEDIYVENASERGSRENSKQIDESIKRNKSLTEARHNLYQDPLSIEALLENVRDAYDALFSTFSMIIMDRPKLNGYIYKLEDFDTDVINPFIEDVEELEGICDEIE